jgi:hypothetical protein
MSSINPRFQYLDMNSHPLAIGQRVSIKHCVGRYGECRTATGELLEIDQYSGVRIRLNHTYTEDRGRFGRRCLVAGDETYIASVFSFKDGIQLGFKKFEDFEHGHEEWIKIEAEASVTTTLPDTQEPTIANPIEPKAWAGTVPTPLEALRDALVAFSRGYDIPWGTLRIAYDNAATQAIPAEPFTLDLNETATILHALRIVQTHSLQNPLCDSHHVCDHFSDGERILTNNEIDELCEKINLTPMPAEMESSPTNDEGEEPSFDEVRARIIDVLRQRGYVSCDGDVAGDADAYLSPDGALRVTTTEDNWILSRLDATIATGENEMELMNALDRASEGN